MKYKYLESRPDRASGELTLKGTRIRIAQVINMLAHGYTIEKLHNVWFPHVSTTTLRGAVRKQRNSSARNPMPKTFYKHKTLLDEHLPPRQVLSRLNHHFDVKHIKHDFNLASLPDPDIYELALSQGRMILTINVKDFRPLLGEDSPGIIGIPEAWSESRIDSKLTALLMRHGPNYFRGRYRPLTAEESTTQAA